MNQCPGCGASLRPGQKFCTGCGTDVRAKAAPTASPDPRAKAGIEIQQKKIESDPLNPEHYLRLGDLYRKEGLDEEALLQFLKVLELDRENSAALTRVAEIEMVRGRTAEAQEALEKVLAADPENTGARLQLFDLNYEAGRYDAALRTSKGVSPAGPAELRFRLRTADALQRLGRPEEALKELAQASGLAPDDTEVLTKLAALHQELGQAEEAIRDYERVLGRSPGHLEAAMAVGRHRFESGDIEGAIPLLRTAHSASPDDVGLSLLLGQALAEQGDAAGAAVALQEVRNLGPKALDDDARSRFARAALKTGAKYLEAGESEMAVSWLRTSLSAKKEREAARMLAEALVAEAEEAEDEEDLPRAEELLSKAAEHDPDHAGIAAALADVRGRIGRGRRKRAVVGASTAAGVVVIAAAVYLAWHFTTGRLQLQYQTAEVQSVRIDGTVYRGGEARLKRGKHVVGVRAADGFADSTFSVVIPGGGKVAIPVRVRPVYGVLRAQSQPSGADVFVDGTRLGKTPLKLDSVQAGFHDVLLKKPGYCDWTDRVRVSPDGETNLGTAEMKGVSGKWTGAARGGKTGWQLEFTQAGASISVDYYYLQSFDYGKPTDYFVGELTGSISNGTISASGTVTHHYRYRSPANVFGSPTPTTERLQLKLEGSLSSDWNTVEGRGHYTGRDTWDWKVKRDTSGTTQIAAPPVAPKSTASRHVYKEGSRNFTAERIHDLEEEWPAGTQLRIRWRTGTPGGHCTGGTARFYVSTDSRSWTEIGSEDYPERRGRDDIVHVSTLTPERAFRFVKVSVPRNYCDFSSAEVNWQ